jgi:adenylate cyclase
MPVEIERKFLVTSDEWRSQAVATQIVQGYLSRDPDRVVRVRIHGDEAYLTVKGRSAGITRTEIEFPISLQSGHDLLPLCLSPLIEKTRSKVTVGSHTWEIDEFQGQSAGLIIAEVELNAENEAFQRPPWIGLEVSHDHKYTNSYLSEHPYSTWS